MQISQKWDFDSFSLDLSHLWNNSSLTLPSDSEEQLTSAWKKLLKKSEDGLIGFFDWPVSNDLTNCLERLKQLSPSVTNQSQGALCMGIGGSYLGPAALQNIFCPFQDNHSFPIEWVSNADTFTIQRAHRFLKNHSKPTAIIISKSGGTTETLSAWFHLSPFFEPERVIVITDPNQGELRRLAALLGWNHLSIPPNIGGRFSVLTAVGLLPLALQNVAIDELVAGAVEMRNLLLQTSPLNNPALVYSFLKFVLDQRGFSLDYLMPYNTRFKLLADWYVQLWGESLGKVQPATGLGVGPTPVSALGTSDQHSLLQLFKDGPKNRLIGFLTVTESDSPKVGEPPFHSPDFSYLNPYSFSELNNLASEATQESLTNAGVPTYRISLKTDSPFALGAFLFFQEVSCALAGEFYGVNAFDQPGVEETKQILKRKLRSS